MKSAGWKAKPDTAEYDEMQLKIVDTTWLLICEKGIANLRLDEVARRSDCARSSVYRYFDSKDQLTFAVLKRELHRLAARIAVTSAHIADPAEQMILGIYGSIQEIRNNPQIRQIWAPENKNNIERMGQAFETVMPVLTDIIEPFLDWARESGSVRENITTEEACRWILMSTLSMAVFGAADKTEEEELAYLHKMLVPAILKY